MDIGAVSMMMSQARVHQSAGIAIAKIALDTNKDNATHIAEMTKNISLDPNVGNQIDVSI